MHFFKELKGLNSMKISTDLTNDQILNFVCPNYVFNCTFYNCYDQCCGSELNAFFVLIRIFGIDMLRIRLDPQHVALLALRLT